MKAPVSAQSVGHVEGERCLAGLWSLADCPFPDAATFGDDPVATWAAVVQMDPTPEKRHLGWLSERVQAGKIPANSFHEVRTLLMWLERTRPASRIKGCQPAPLRCSDIRALSDMVRPHQSEPLASETIFHLATGQVTVLEPLTSFAFGYWGRGAIWEKSTQARRSYVPPEESGLRTIIYVLEDGDRYLSEATNGLLDSCGYRIQWSNLTRSERRQMLGTDELCEIALEQCSTAAYAIPTSAMSEKVAMMIVRATHGRIGIIPPGKQTEAACRRAVEMSGWALQHVAKRLRTREICELAVRRTPGAIRYVPRNHAAEIMMSPWFEPGTGQSYPLGGDIGSAKTIASLIRRGKIGLSGVPPTKRSVALCELAVSQRLDALPDVPPSKRTHRVFEAAARNHPWALRRIPREVLTAKICALGVTRTGRSIVHVPPELLTNKLCEIAVKQDGTAIEYIPRNLITERVALLAVTEYGLALDKVPKALRTQPVCAEAVRQNSRAIAHVPYKLRASI